MLGRYRRMWYSASGRGQLLKMISRGVFLAVIVLFLATTVVFALFSIDLPDPNKVIRREGLSTVIYDRQGKTLYDLYSKENRIPLELSAIPKYLQQATIAIEDKDFYKHQGVSLTGIIRSLVNIITLQGLQGGSTLTQQLVKNVLLSPERTVFRKIREVILANQIESRFTKDQILQMYLNEAPYGGAAYGVESAAKSYFGKSAKDLTLLESAILASFPQAPSRYSPRGANPKAYIDRTKQVLRRLREDGYITAQQEQDVAKELGNVKFASSPVTINAPHFVFFVRELLVKQFGEQMVESGGLRVTTTLDIDLQKKVEVIVNQEVEKIKTLKVSNGAAVVLNPKTGEVLSLVGSYDFFDEDYGSYNVATALRQPGSAGKPFIYATAFTKGYTSATLLSDVKTDYPTGDPDVKKKEYTPENYDDKYRGPIELRFALGNSINTVAVKLTAATGLKDIMTAGFQAGISTWEPTTENIRDVGLSLALGGREVKLLEMTAAYATFANEGVKVDPVSLLKVTDPKGKTLYEYKKVTGKRVFSPQVSFLIADILSDNNARKDVFGQVSLLEIPGHNVAVKTGTTDKKRDNWTFGFDAGNTTVGVWVGNNDNSVMAPAITSGVTGAAPIWNKIMKAALEDLPTANFSRPEGVVSLDVDAFGGGLPYGDNPVRTEKFIKGTEPTGPATIYKKIKVSKSDGKLANDLQIKSGDYEEKDYIVITESDPVSEKGTNRWQEAIDKWIAENKKDEPKYHPPKETSPTDQSLVKVTIETPQDRQRIDNPEVTVKAKAYAVRPIVKFSLEIDGTEQLSKSVDSLDEKIILSSGSHKLKLKATDSAGNLGQAEIQIGVNAPWDAPLATSSGVFVLSFDA